MSLYLVTGGAGFIGSNIITELLKSGEKIRSIDNFATGRRENIAEFLDRIEFIEGDVRSLETVRKAAEGADFILHQAALASVPRSVKDPAATTEANVNGTLNVLIAGRDAGVKRVVCASSSSVYGDTPTLPKHEAMIPQPLSPYAASKLAGEAYCRAFANVYGLQTVSLRYFNVFGPKQDPASQYSAVIPRFITAMLAGKSPTIFGDGEQSRDFTFVTNVIEANLLACSAEGVAGEAFNCGCHERTTVNDLVKTLNEILGTEIEPVYVESRPGDVRHSYADITKAQQLLGYNPNVGFAEGLRRTGEWYKSNSK